MPMGQIASSSWSQPWALHNGNSGVSQRSEVKLHECKGGKSSLTRTKSCHPGYKGQEVSSDAALAIGPSCCCSRWSPGKK